MKKILCFLGFHKKKTMEDFVCNVWGEVIRTWKCERCNKWESEIISAGEYNAELNWKCWKNIEKIIRSS